MKKYPHAIVIVTLVCNLKCKNCMKTYGDKIHIIVDNYGPDLSPKAEENVEKLTQNGISCELRDMYSEKRHHGGWVDFIAPEKPFRDIEDAKQTYLNCGQAQKLKNCCNIINGLLMPCHMQFQLNDRGIVDAKALEFEWQCIDLFDDSESWERKREKMDTYTDVSRLPYLESCRYCNCLSEDTPRLKPAVQADSLDDLPFRI